MTITWAKLVRIIKEGRLKKERIDWAHRNSKKKRSRERSKLRRKQLQRMRRKG